MLTFAATELADEGTSRHLLSQNLADALKKMPLDPCPKVRASVAVVHSDSAHVIGYGKPSMLRLTPNKPQLVLRICSRPSKVTPALAENASQSAGASLNAQRIASADILFLSHGLGIHLPLNTSPTTPTMSCCA